MTDLSANANLRFLGEVKIEKFPFSDDIYPATVYKGAPMIIDQSADGTHITTADGVTMVDGDVFVGIAAHGAVASGGGVVTETEIECYVGPTIVGFKSTAFDNADLGKPVWMSDTGTLTDSGGAYPRIGKLYAVRDGYCFVQLDSPFVIDVP